MILSAYRIVTAGFILLAVVKLGEQLQSASAAPAYFHIHGTVVDGSSGSPLADAKVVIALAGESDALQVLITNEDGKFAFKDLAGGKYRLSAECRGYVAQSFDQHEGHFSLIAVGADVPSQDLIFRLPPESSISGQIRDERGEGIRHAVVMLFQQSASDGVMATHLRKDTKTDDRGFYTFSHLSAGRYCIAVSAQPWYARHPGFPRVASFGSLDREQEKNPGEASNSVTDERVDPPLDVSYPVTFYPGVNDPDAATIILLAQGGRERADVSFHPMPSLRLRIRTANPEQVQGNDITLEQSVFDYHIPVPIIRRQAGPGVVEVGGIPAGHYTIKIASLEQQHVVAETREVDVSRSGELNKLNGITSAMLTAMFQEVIPPAEAVLSLREKRSGEIIEERIAGRRKFQFRQRLASGEYDLALLSSSDLFIRSISANGLRIAGRRLKIKGPEPVNLTIVVGHGTGRLEGMVVRTNKPVAGAMVVLVPEDPENNSALFQREQSNADGSFVFTMVVPGKYTVLAIANAWDLEWASPKALEPYLGRGDQVQVGQNRGNSGEVIINVQ